jgi:hypothetical protein
MTTQEKDKDRSIASPVRRVEPVSAARKAARGSGARTKTSKTCADCRATTAFQAWESVDLTPSFNVGVSFAEWKIVPKGKRAVIELVTAQIIVPSGEWARLRMYTSLGSVPSNIDLFVTFQGNVGGSAVYVATHSLRVYSDNSIDFNINRDNAITTGSALICISGYIAG